MHVYHRKLAKFASFSRLLKTRKNQTEQTKKSLKTTLDLRLLNAIIKHSNYPMPKIQEIISNITEHKYFTLFDMPLAYHQVNLPEKYQERICFTSLFGTYKLKRMPQGLKTSAGHF